MIYAVLTSLVLFVGPSLGQNLKLGTCPAIEPVSGFDMKRMLGLWYVIEKTLTPSSCLVYNFIAGNKKDHYGIIETSQNPVPGTPIWHQRGTSGTLTVPEASTPGRMIVEFPLKVLGGTTFTVFSTDYNNYAAIFTCQQVAFSHRKSISILSRDKWLDQVYLDRIRMKMHEMNINPYELSIISQSDCPNTSDWNNINLDSDTFSVKGAVNAVKQARGVLSGGLNYVFNEAIQKLTGTEKEKYDKIASKSRAEWLP